MKRRSLMAMIGLAPVAGASGAIRTPGPPPPSWGGNDIPTMMADAVAEKHDPLEFARERVKALAYVRKHHGREEPEDLAHALIEPRIRSMRSWSEVTKTRRAAEQFRQFYADERYNEAVRTLKREVRNAALPDWVRRWL